MLLRQMLWAPRRIPVCAFERTSRGIFSSDHRLIFLGRLTVSPVLFMGATGYFAYLSNRSRFRSAVLSELRRIMSFADLDTTYQVENWFMKKNRLFVHVAEKGQRIGQRLDSSTKRFLPRFGRKPSGPQ